MLPIFVFNQSRELETIRAQLEKVLGCNNRQSKLGSVKPMSYELFEL
jgi:hypothetical protein